MGLTSAEQEEREAQKQRDLAQERVARRERLGHQPAPEPALESNEE